MWDLAASGPDRVYALGDGGVFRGPKGWNPMGFDGNACKALAATSDALWCMREKRKPLRGKPAP